MLNTGGDNAVALQATHSNKVFVEFEFLKNPTGYLLKTLDKEQMASTMVQYKHLHNKLETQNLLETSIVDLNKTEIGELVLETMGGGHKIAFKEDRQCVLLH